MKIEVEREDDGRWIAEVPDLSGVMVFVFVFHERDETGPKMLARIARRTGLTPNDL